MQGRQDVRQAGRQTCRQAGRQAGRQASRRVWQASKARQNKARQRIQSLYESLFQRPVTLKETENLQEFLGDFEATVTENKEAELKTWTALVHTLLLSSEYIHVD